ncbi:SIMPL domain-containing protein [uncultured Enterovirga sp.]|uniref:SIMPL domain-containing protein n=1 Tax=uncultured Enterovirga sp. TaxID=2026352 RepID=UPI0035C9EC35
MRLAALLSLALLAPALAQEPPRPLPGPRLHLTGKATLEAAPDFASISIGVGARAPTAAGAIDLTSVAAAKIVVAARTFRIEPRDLQTSYVSLQPAFRTVRDGNASEQRPDGYQATNSVAIRVRDLARLGDFLRIVVDGGANRIDGVNFELADPGKLEREALAAAVKDGLRQAEVIAEAAGVKLGRIEEIRSGARPARPVASFRFSGGTSPPPPPAVPVEAGSLSVSSEVELVVAIGQP